MIEKLVLDYLNSELPVRAYMEKQGDMADKYVLIEKVGSGSTDYIKRATIIIQSYASSLFETVELNEKVKNAMEHITELEDISKCELNSDYNYTDTTKKQYRYQAVFDIVHF